MPLQIRRIEGTTFGEIQQRKFNPVIGLSIGNKAFTDELIREYLKWSLKYCKEKVLVCIADSLYITNYLVLDGYSQSRAKRVASKLGDEYLHCVQRIISAFTKRDQEKIEIIRFDELKKDPEYIRLRDFFYQQYRLSKTFKAEVLEITKDYLRHRNRSESKAEDLSAFVLDELPIFYQVFDFMEIIFP